MMNTSLRSMRVSLSDSDARDAGLAALRGVTGGLLTGHGAQKLFGAFKGPGLEGTAGFMEALGLQPGKLWGTAAALSEFGGGTLTTLGLLQPLGSISVISSMVMATATAHRGKPIWVTEGGAELPVVNIAVATALMLAGPGKFSLDEALGIRLPAWLVALAALGAGAAVGYGIMTRPTPPQPAQDEARTGAQSGEPAAASASS
jgi:putative oxidoreductase